ncbi:S-adenosyl-L-methionine-dependent methyltransferase [Mycena rebaudengoi]|nr:S-adenosyl-L-methionine-dependent methyltransferase [Mycena rebaudengoi]
MFNRMFGSGHNHSHDQSHDHSHSHSHSHGGGGDGAGWTSDNVHLYEQVPLAAEMGDRVPKQMRKAYPFNEETTTVMDFACGTGTGSLASTSTPAMVENFSKRISDNGISPEEMSVVCADLKGEESELDGEKFDVVVCSAAYHHFESIDAMTRTLCFFLKPGGCLLVADFMKSDKPVPENVPNKEGFSEEDIKRASTGQMVNVFLAKGTKPNVTVE